MLNQSNIGVYKKYTDEELITSLINIFGTSGSHIQIIKALFDKEVIDNTIDKINKGEIKLEIREEKRRDYVIYAGSETIYALNKAIDSSIEYDNAKFL